MKFDLLAMLAVLALVMLLAYRGREIGSRQKRVILAGIAVIVLLVLVTLVQSLVF